MKKFLLAIMLLIPLMASAESVEIDGIYYNLITNSNQAEVTKSPEGYSGTVTIPSSFIYNGTEYSVTSIGEWSFFNSNGLTSVSIPNSINLNRYT